MKKISLLLAIVEGIVFLVVGMKRQIKIIGQRFNQKKKSSSG